MNFKFKVGDRVRVTKIDDLDFYGDATYSVGDVGTIITGYDSGHGIAYCIDFEKGTIDTQRTWENKPTYGIWFENGQYWSAKEEWLKPANQLIMCE